MVAKRAAAVAAAGKIQKLVIDKKKKKKKQKLPAKKYTLKPSALKHVQALVQGHTFQGVRVDTAKYLMHVNVLEDPAIHLQGMRQDVRGPLLLLAFYSAMSKLSINKSIPISNRGLGEDVIKSITEDIFFPLPLPEKQMQLEDMEMHYGNAAHMPGSTARNPRILECVINDLAHMMDDTLHTTIFFGLNLLRNSEVCRPHTCIFHLGTKKSIKVHFGDMASFFKYQVVEKK